MKLVFVEKAWNEYLYWQKTDKRILKKINLILKQIQRNPYLGPGKPEPLMHDLSGFWSLRIDLEHRLIYKIESDQIIILKCRHHYD
jgi:toxin YoeB